MNALICPHCQNTEVVKVSAITSSGTWSSSSSSLTIGGGQFLSGANDTFVTGSLGSTSHQGATRLASLLAQPTPPMETVFVGPNGGSWGVAGTGCLGMVLLGLAALSLADWAPGRNPQLPTIFGILSLSAFVGCIALARFNKANRIPKAQTEFEERKARYQSDTARFERLSHLWKELFYCPKCDRAFVPGSPRSTSVEDWKQLVD